MASSGIVPIIDFAPFLTGSQAQKEQVARELFKACTDVRRFWIVWTILDVR